LSGDGKTALLGAPKHELLFGGVYTFTGDGSKWTQSDNVLGGKNEIRNGELGVSISIAADGNTLAVGGPGDNSGRGAVWIFTRNGGAWMSGPKLTARDEVGPAQFGYGVALSADG